MTQKHTQEEIPQNDSQKETAAEEPRLPYFVLTLGIYAFIAYLFLKVCYLFYIRDFSSFRIDWWAILLCLCTGLVYWFVHELLYKKHGPAPDSQK